MAKVLDNSEDKIVLIILGNVILFFTIMIILYYWNFMENEKIRKFIFLFGYIFITLLIF